MTASKLEVLPPLNRMAPEDHDKKINALFTYYGVAKDFIDCSGRKVVIPHSHRLSILQLLGVDANNEVAVDNTYRYFTRDRYSTLMEPVNVVAADAVQQVRLYLPEHRLHEQLEWKIQPYSLSEGCSDIEVSSGEVSATALPQTIQLRFDDCVEKVISVRSLTVPALPLGYYTLSVSGDLGTCKTLLIVAPAQCYRPNWEQEGRRLAGISVQLYSLRSSRNWGVGDFSDLKQLLVKAKHCGIDFVVLNPLHILDASEPEQCSPYSPIDRCRLNPLYVDPVVEPDFIESDSINKQFHSSRFQRALQKSRAPEFVNYTEVTELKYSVLGQMFSHFKKYHLSNNSARAQMFFDFIAAQGTGLKNFTRYQAQQTHGFIHAKDPLFHAYLQWLSETQLESCQQLAKRSGMAIGLVRDLAVGSQRDSAEVALNPELFCVKASIGAPPDPLAPQGQNWGLPPMKPLALRQKGYKHFIELLQANMAHCQALRLDHVMGLMRLWWCPEVCYTNFTPEPECLGEAKIQDGGTANKIDKAQLQNMHGEGAYVMYPVDDLFAILRLESHRNQCLVIGEDLGIVPPEIRHHMSTSALFSNALFYFEKYDPVHFKAPQHFNTKALTMVANHDVPTLAAWWNKSDLATRSQINLIPSDDEYRSAVHSRESDLIQVLHWLNDSGLLPDAWRDFNIHRPFDMELCCALLQANARSSSQLVSVQLEDLCLTESPVNIPGTSNEYPNWRRKVPYSIEHLFSKEFEPDTVIQDSPCDQSTIPLNTEIECENKLSPLSLINAFVHERYQ